MESTKYQIGINYLLYLFWEVKRREICKKYCKKNVLLKTLVKCQNLIAWENPLLIYGHKVNTNIKDYIKYLIIIWDLIIYTYQVIYCSNWVIIAKKLRKNGKIVLLWWAEDTTPATIISISKVISILRILFLKAFNVYADLAAVDNFPITFALNNVESACHMLLCCT